MGHAPAYFLKNNSIYYTMSSQSHFTSASRLGGTTTSHRRRGWEGWPDIGEQRWHLPTGRNTPPPRRRRRRRRRGDSAAAAAKQQQQKLGGRKVQAAASPLALGMPEEDDADDPGIPRGESFASSPGSPRAGAAPTGGGNHTERRYGGAHTQKKIASLLSVECWAKFWSGYVGKDKTARLLHFTFRGLSWALNGSEYGEMLKLLSRQVKGGRSAHTHNSTHTHPSQSALTAGEVGPHLLQRCVLKRSALHSLSFSLSLVPCSDLDSPQELPAHEVTDPSPPLPTPLVHLIPQARHSAPIRGAVLDQESLSSRSDPETGLLCSQRWVDEFRKTRDSFSASPGEARTLVIDFLHCPTLCVHRISLCVHHLSPVCPLPSPCVSTAFPCVFTAFTCVSTALHCLRTVRRCSLRLLHSLL